MALSRLGSSNFKQEFAALDEQNSTGAEVEERNSNADIQGALNVSGVRSHLKHIEELCESHSGREGEHCSAFCSLMLGSVQKSIEALNLLEDYAKTLEALNQMLMRKCASLSSTRNVLTYYESPAGPVEIVPAPKFQCGSSLLTITDTALKMVNPSKQKTRSRNGERKKLQAPIQLLKTGEDGKIPDDGFCWRKYGSKVIKTAKFKKAYYRCHAPCAKIKGKRCLAKRTIQQSDNDPTTMHVTYESGHSCRVPDRHSSGYDCLGDILPNEGRHAREPDHDAKPFAPFGLVRTSSDSVSVLSQEDMDERTEAVQGTRELVGDGDLDLEEFSDLPDLRNELSSWSTGAGPDQCKDQLTFTDMDPDQLLMDHILQGKEQDFEDFQEHVSLHRSSYFSNIQGWHPHGK